MADFADRELDHGVNGNFQPDDPSGLENPIVEEVQDSMVLKKNNNNKNKLKLKNTWYVSVHHVQRMLCQEHHIMLTRIGQSGKNLMMIGMSKVFTFSQ